ncbi:hypothetical protein Sjap_009920 [Stephania japonica]|uniref:Zinc finger Mcm10/DnaG-type domain-containing protein n=1 Tax=Stephania japonica TaxID=461633 RepID=A0AAP0J8M3_9MAGN
MATNDEDLALLLSLQDKVFETPPGSPCTSLRATSPEYYAGNSSRARAAPADMSVFRDAVRDYLEDCPSTVTDTAPKAKASKESKSVHVEKFSGLRIRNLVLSSVDINNCFTDSRFIRLNAIRNSLSGDNISGCWVTVGVFVEKWAERLSSTGKKYCIWKIGCLDEGTFSLFVFGDAYSRNTSAETGTVYAFFNAGIRKDPAGKGFSLSVFTAGQVLKMGTSADYGVCKGDRNGGAPCTTVINKRQGLYCKYHNSKKSEKYSAVRSELRGGNVSKFFRYPPRLEGIYMVDPLRDKTNQQKSKQPLKVLSVDGLKKALSKAGEVTTNTHSQGIRFLKEIAKEKTEFVPFQVGFIDGSDSNHEICSKLAHVKGPARSSAVLWYVKVIFQSFSAENPISVVEKLQMLDSLSGDSKFFDTEFLVLIIDFLSHSHICDQHLISG